MPGTRRPPCARAASSWSGGCATVATRLFDPVADPAETTDIGRRAPDIRNRLAGLLTRHLDETRPVPAAAERHRLPPRGCGDRIPTGRRPPAAAQCPAPHLRPVRAHPGHRAAGAGRAPGDPARRRPGRGQPAGPALLAPTPRDPLGVCATGAG
ncbi:hypothetical protein [Nocardioides convexus]|uniref:hypothetical protein n=1 Tax=Nocardioides convexus TaxID=2712224 RepID=UPI002418ABD4|nr:hypothetical protein [Nocardioides convexus]